MNKILAIAWKDVTIAFRDRAGLLLMLAAPFVLTLGMGFVSGRFSGDDGGLRAIPVVVVNQDEGPLGELLEQAFFSADLAALLAPERADDPAAARGKVKDDTAAAAVIIPAAFSAGILPDPASGLTGAPAAIELHTNPARPISAGVVRAIVESFVDEVETARVGGQVAVTQLIAHGLLSPQDAVQAGTEIGARLAAGQGAQPLIAVRANQAEAGRQPEFDLLAYFAPGMAMMFLMYTVSMGGRSILAEKAEGTLARLLSTPSTSAQILGGKVLGIFLTGAAQVGVLVLASTLLFGLRWGDPLAVLILVLAVAAAATGWGLILTAFARTPNQVSNVGGALMLVFAILGGSFVSQDSYPGWLRALSKISPNAWGQEGFTALGSGGGLADVAPGVGALALMAALLFAVAVVLFERRGLVRG